MPRVFMPANSELKVHNSRSRPLYRRIRGRKSSGRAESVDARVQVMKKWVYSAETSPRVSVAYSADEWRKSCDSESSIYEAVLHCKRSIGK
ncbi:probable membrane-associated kinase regulator 6 isoform X2 [Herrania umbratica]|uniref:Probable membrane-associated kinase regulator 6 isoform X2 n=1 Tax=Herrania umbratica TaxID=108875 RepID=A0A6J0ZXS2_9ROSI|nr:probable membrane-associated kinase regulator 6 isoform X2 [Herrania umbratica]XP_021279619.1 probable membrane-associated kinase regulator 6 isoform X2 [Herrania umbratica]XP_021279627.1 probable membrane-associated kinase regulator 6 isoform X2 [Herrania umbratica]